MEAGVSLKNLLTAVAEVGDLVEARDDLRNLTEAGGVISRPEEAGDDLRILVEDVAEIRVLMEAGLENRNLVGAGAGLWSHVVGGANLWSLRDDRACVRNLENDRADIRNLEDDGGLVCPGLECIHGINGILQHGLDLIPHLDDPDVLCLIIGVHLLKHGLLDAVNINKELVVDKPDVMLYEKVEIVVISARVMTDGGHKAAEYPLLLCDPGCQFPDHDRQPDAGARGHTDMGVESWLGELVSNTRWLLG